MNKGIIFTQATHNALFTSFSHSIDGWEVSLTNAMVPVGRGSSDMLFCVSLTLSNIDAPAAQVSLDDLDVAKHSIDELCHDTESHVSSIEVDHNAFPQCTNNSFRSPLFVIKSNEKPVRKMKVSSKLVNFNLNLNNQLSLRTVAQKEMIGISLVSKRNVVPAMRRTLSLLFEDFCAMKSSDSRSKVIICQPLVDLLSVFSNSSIEEASLKSILEPYICHAVCPWIQRPLRDQSKEMIQFCGMQLLQSLPPVPLALLFVTAFLEQKVRVLCIQLCCFLLLIHSRLTFSITLDCIFFFPKIYVNVSINGIDTSHETI